MGQSITCLSSLLTLILSFDLSIFHSLLILNAHAQDLVDAIAKVRHGNGIASQHRKRVASLPTRLAGLVVGSLNTSGVGFIKSMTPVERHAELVYAESLFEKVSGSRSRFIPCRSSLLFWRASCHDVAANSNDRGQIEVGSPVLRCKIGWSPERPLS